MKILFSIISGVLLFMLLICGMIAQNSQKAIGKSVAVLNFSLLLPVTGSLLISNTHERWIATAGGYFYFIGINFVILALMHFATEYCKNSGTGHKIPHFVYAFLGLDTLQLLLNPFLAMLSA